MYELTDFEWRYKLWKAYQQKEQIKKEFKLMKKYNRDKSQKVVLSIINLVINVPFRRIQFPIIKVYDTFLYIYAE